MRSKAVSGKHNDLAARAAGAFLWIAQFLAIPVARLRDLFGPGILVCGYVVFVALFAVAVWKVGTAKRMAGRVRPTFLPGALLLSDPVALLLGAPSRESPRHHALATTC